MTTTAEEQQTRRRKRRQQQLPSYEEFKRKLIRQMVNESIAQSATTQIIKVLNGSTQSPPPPSSSSTMTTASAATTTLPTTTTTVMSPESSNLTALFNSSTAELLTTTTTEKPTIQLLYADSQSTFSGANQLVGSLCKNIDNASVWTWTNVFCYAAILLALICGVIYAVRSLYTLLEKIEQRIVQLSHKQHQNGQSSNRETAVELPRDEQNISRVLPIGPDPARFDDNPPYPLTVFVGDQRR